jgi:uncharacterized membrane protein YphA (DoxX/SURF4 family)
METSTNPTLHRSLSKTWNIVTWVLQVLLALAFLGAGAGKLTGAEEMVASFEKLGVGQWFRLFTGSLEVVCAIGLMVPRTTFYAAVLLCATMVGAVIAHLSVLGGNPAPAIILLMIAGAVAYLRRPSF